MSKKNIFVIAIVLTLGVFSFAACTPKSSEEAETNSGYQKISAEEAKAMMDNNDYDIILDVRTGAEYAEGYIPGAVNLPLDEIEVKIGEVLPSTDSKILLYCRSGNRSKEAGKLLESLGYTKVYDFGGIVDWPY